MGEIFCIVDAKPDNEIFMLKFRTRAVHVLHPLILAWPTPSRHTLSNDFLGEHDGRRLQCLQRYLDNSCRKISMSTRGQKPV